MNHLFRFQRFAIDDSRAAMKIGTDAVLLGSWTPLRGAKRILDVGTGCGIVALMLAQRSEAQHSQISAIDIDPAAAQQAIKNFASSPWPGRLPRRREEALFSLGDFTDREPPSSFDLIVCNPPFFEPSQQTEASPRKRARETETLHWRQLLEQAAELLVPTGTLAMILPFDQATQVVEACPKFGFSLVAQTSVRPTPESAPKRILFELELKTSPSDRELPSQNELVVETSRHQYSDDYRRLTEAFHLRYA